MTDDECKAKAEKALAQNKSFLLIAGGEVEGEPGHVQGSTLSHVEDPLTQATIACRAIDLGIEMHQDLLNAIKGDEKFPQELGKKIQAVLGTLKLAFERFLEATGLDGSITHDQVDADALMKEAMEKAGKIVPIAIKKHAPNLN